MTENEVAEARRARTTGAAKIVTTGTTRGTGVEIAATSGTDIVGSTGAPRTTNPKTVSTTRTSARGQSHALAQSE